MSDPVTNVEIEDVLSSIRRLVSEDTRAANPDHAPSAAPVRPPEALVLTQEHRVVEAPAPAAQVSETARSIVKSSTRLELERAIAELEAAVGLEDAATTTEEHSEHDETSYEDDLDWDAPIGRAVDGTPSDAEFQAADDVEADAEQAGEDAGEPETSDAEAVEDAEEVWADADDNPRIDEPADETIVEEEDASDAQTAEVEADSETYALDTETSTDGSEDLSAEEFFADAATDGGLAPEDALEDDEPEQQVSVEVSSVGDASGAAEPSDIPRSDPIVTPFLRQRREPDPVESTEYVAFVEDTSDDHGGVAHDPFDDEYLEDSVNDPFAEQVIDEAMLRDLVADIVRQELQGELGERITRNVRKLVRREINRALAGQDFI
ncbi:hypothetical protein [Shimia ponticola]|uniref:hypothetical protein n=1 Tax=Shimia ponticola TaxID=2582893 RepID=UPI0011BFE573|nr:hypothetical protein [Shimia ponticola]